jgi:hypothetical protein
MYFKNIFFSIVFLLVIPSGVFAQKWVDNQVNNLTYKVNTKLIASNENLKLSEEQELQVRILYKQFILYKSEKGKSIQDKNELWEAIKPKFQETNKAVKSILSSEQLAAYNAYKAK